MSLHDKYNPVLKLGEDFNVKDGYVEEAEGVLKIGGTAATQFEKDRMWDKIKEIGGEAPSDIEADIKVANTGYYHRHMVVSGDSLSKIAKMYYGDPMKYMDIFNANTNILKDPNLIHPGQELVIPFPS
ncbi:LysM peptidoglycan-binding domain-containing protein [Pontibacter sp. G13]|uniref:LysM peptidoglycan-binding domain-containing protein n=1 Tax=Pontibacter sp. G13 TaxID=3074898 RepID=UPI00288985C4|nr:LysM peptidoglycan-binding domain-containing protein [Pontibacter sp. G13]WNJ19397.1 LysM peptidoglycan-binding domain-containing protein [Pontibacter sp. G13]